MTKPRTINVKECWDIKAKPSWRDGSFVLMISNEKLKVNIHFERYWISLIANCLWEVICHEEQVINEARVAMQDIKDK